jgi:hypothetical protein
VSVSLRREDMGAHFTKWYVEGLPAPAILHRFTIAEPNADPHDHPWSFTSFVVSGGYTEEVFDLAGSMRLVDHPPGEAFRVEAGRIHRIVRLWETECWTLVVPGPPERVPGFYRWADGEALHRPWNRPDFQPVRESSRQAT